MQIVVHCLKPRYCEGIVLARVFIIYVLFHLAGSTEVVGVLGLSGVVGLSGA